MAITSVKVKDIPNPFYFPESKLAHKLLDGLTGLEIGCGWHNNFGLAGSRNVAPADDEVFHAEEARLTGHYAHVDIVAEGDDIPVEDESQDYVISSHVLEHMPSLFNAFLEWNRIVKPGGYIYIVVPKRNAHKPDEKRPISKVSEFLQAWDDGWSVDNPAPAEVLEAAGGVRGHYWVFTLESLVELIECAKVVCGLDWEIVATEESDSKVGNGHTVVCRKRPAAGPEYETGSANMVFDTTVTTMHPRLKANLPFEFASALPRIEVGSEPDPVEDNLVRRLHERDELPRG